MPGAHSEFMNQQDTIQSDLLCPECGYNLRGLVSGRCPECGSKVDLEALIAREVPWTYRLSQGRFRSYWKTVWWVMFHRERLYSEIEHPVHYGHAQRFRLTTILHICIPFFVLSLVGAVGSILDMSNAKVDWGIILIHSGAWVVLNACLFLFLLAATGVPSYFFHPQQVPVEKQNRAIALSHYACAPLAWIPLIIILSVLLGISSNYFMNDLVSASLASFAVILPVFLPLAWFFALIHLAKDCLQRSNKSVLILGIGLWASWIGLAVSILIILPLSLLFLLASLASLF